MGTVDFALVGIAGLQQTKAVPDMAFALTPNELGTHSLPSHLPIIRTLCKLHLKFVFICLTAAVYKLNCV